jgi:hypothetical protein
VRAIRLIILVLSGHHHLGKRPTYWHLPTKIEPLSIRSFLLNTPGPHSAWIESAKLVAIRARDVGSCYLHEPILNLRGVVLKAG